MPRYHHFSIEEIKHAFDVVHGAQLVKLGNSVWTQVEGTPMGSVGSPAVVQMVYAKKRGSMGNKPHVWMRRRLHKNVQNRSVGDSVAGSADYCKGCLETSMCALGFPPSGAPDQVQMVTPGNDMMEEFW